MCSRERRLSVTAVVFLIAASSLSLILAACGQRAAGIHQPATAATATAEAIVQTGELARLEPARGAYFGVNLDWSNDTAANFNERLGQNAALYVQFVHFPFKPEDADYLDGFFEQTSAQGGIALLTLEPVIPLSKITPEVAAEFAGYLAEVRATYDVAIMVRFAHEMNGSWYSWSQQPEAYVAAFRTVAAAVHLSVPDAAMIWAPNYGAGYPFPGGQHLVTHGSPEFAILDTNSDGTLNMLDDPYSPYYPGDDVVDWVGLSLYHWGSTWPWGENEVPEPDKFANQLTGNFNGLNGDERDVPDFYHLFAEQRGKPIAIVETAALYSPEIGGANALEIKQTWWNQVYSSESRERFPQIKMINWFEWDKFETETNGRIDWTLTRGAFLDDFNSEAYVFAPVR
ncbi:hypothetical protein BH23CHL2_BH23CHL2_11670 [soil metagenome]